MTRTAALPAVASFPALGTTATLLVTDPRRLAIGEAVLRTELAAIDRACSRFRLDSELARVNRTAGAAVTVSELFAEAVQAALRAARLTGGSVDPTVGHALAELGYDRTFTALPSDDPRPVAPARPAPGWRQVTWDRHLRRLRLPAGGALDLGATAKALAADRAAGTAAAAAGCGVQVNLGGDVATAGDPPAQGWPVGLADDHATAISHRHPTVTMTGGGMATSGTRVRSWRRAGRVLHHIIDPATGAPADPYWRTVTVAAASCVEANAAATAAVVRGCAAAGWLRRTGLPARLVRPDGTVLLLGGWPPDRLRVPSPEGWR